MLMNVKRMQDLECSMLKEIDTICQRNGILYYTVVGTALGAIRHKGPIPWDSDTDIAVPYEDFNRFCTTVKKELSNSFYIDTYIVTGRDEDFYAKIGVSGYSDQMLHIDVYPLLGTPNDENKRRKYINKIINIKWIHYFKNNDLHKQYLLYRILSKLIPISATYYRNKYESIVKKYPFNSSEYSFISQGTYARWLRVPTSYFGTPRREKYGDFEVNVPQQCEKYLQLVYGDYLQFPDSEYREKMMKQEFEISERH